LIPDFFKSFCFFPKSEEKSASRSTTTSKHHKMAASPRASFFAEFAGFVPDHSAHITDEFARLAKHRNWAFRSKNYKRQWNRCMRAEFQTAYTNVNLSRLQSWQNLCLELGLEAAPSITQCKKVS
jgi:hypothetical protein